MVFRMCRAFWLALGEVTEVHVLNILLDTDFENFFHNFCDVWRFLKKWKQGKGFGWPCILIPLSNTRNKNINETFCSPHQPSPTIKAPPDKKRTTKWCFPQYLFLTAIELGPPVSKSSTRITNVKPPLLLHTDLVKRELKPFKGIELGYS